MVCLSVHYVSYDIEEKEVDDKEETEEGEREDVKKKTLRKRNKKPGNVCFFTFRVFHKT
jgi:hypothetical protein